jgi:hypothetical protein
MAVERDWTKAVKVLVEKTNNGNIRWSEGHYPPDFRENAVGPVYKAVVGGRWLAVYEYSYKYYTDADEFEWRQQAAIEFVQEDGTLEWKWPETPLGWELLDAIRAQQAGAAHFYDQLVKD